MGRPRSVEGGRPHIVRVRLSDRELAALEQARGGTSRSDYLRSSIHAPAIPQIKDGRMVAAPIAEPDPPPPYRETRHRHVWKRAGEYLDACDCGYERVHQAGTR